MQAGFVYLEKAAAYDITTNELKTLTEELTLLENMQPRIGVITKDRKGAVRSIIELTIEARLLLDKLDDGFEGMIDDESYLSNSFAIRKIKGRHIPKAAVPLTPGLQ